MTQNDRRLVSRFCVAASNFMCTLRLQTIIVFVLIFKFNFRSAKRATSYPISSENPQQVERSQSAKRYQIPKPVLSLTPSSN